MTSIPLKLEIKGQQVEGTAIPLQEPETDGIPSAFAINLGDEYIGVIHCHSSGWKMDTEQDPELVQTIGSYLHNWFE